LQQGDQMNCKDRKEEREVDFPFGSIFSLVCSFSHLKRIRFYLNTHCIMWTAIKHIYRLFMFRQESIQRGGHKTNHISYNNRLTSLVSRYGLFVRKKAVFLWMRVFKGWIVGHWHNSYTCRNSECTELYWLNHFSQKFLSPYFPEVEGQRCTDTTGAEFHPVLFGQSTSRGVCVICMFRRSWWICHSCVMILDLTTVPVVGP
jgi:hypothetical protein